MPFLRSAALRGTGEETLEDRGAQAGPAQALLETQFDLPGSRNAGALTRPPGAQDPVTNRG